MKKFIKNNKSLTFLGILLLFVLWFIISEIIGEKEIIFPGPIETIKDFFRLITFKSTYVSILHSLYKMLIGYLISIILALIFGIISGIYPSIEKILKPTIIALKAVPTASIIYLFIVLAKFKHAPIYVVVLVSFPILYESIVGGIRNIPRSINDALSLDGGNSLRNIAKVKVPLATNYILVGIASSFGLAFKIEIMAEVISGYTGYGIGSSIHSIQQSDASMVPIMSWTLIAVIILLIITLLSNCIKTKLIMKA